jgi:hypothetical protein
MAIKWIHDHLGIVDRTNGDEILSFFGFDNEDKKSGLSRQIGRYIYFW